MSVGAGDVGTAGRRGPREPAGPGLFQLPAGVLLELVVLPAGAAEVAAAGPSVLVVGDGVVQVGAPGGLTAGAEPAGHIPGGDMLAQPRRRPVRRRLAGVHAPAGR